ncbi:unnamed protein product [Lathyrus sativus]|nr:unnamed protein product [Lathyrus sativus]
MENQIDAFLKKLSYGAITIASLTLFSLFLRTLDTCVPQEAPPKPHLRFPKSSCDFTSTRPHLPFAKKNNRIWSSRDWNNKLHSISLIFLPIRDIGLLPNHSKILCISAGASHEVVALQRLGVNDVTGVELFDSSPLVSHADPHNLSFFDGAFDFGFTARFDEALFPARFAAEMERVVRPGGVCFVLVRECGSHEVRDVVRLFRNSRFVTSSNVTLIGIRITSILLRTRKSS